MHLLNKQSVLKYDQFASWKKKKIQQKLPKLPAYTVIFSHYLRADVVQTFNIHPYARGKKLQHTVPPFNLVDTERRCSFETSDNRVMPLMITSSGTYSNTFNFI